MNLRSLRPNVVPVVAVASLFALVPLSSGAQEARVLIKKSVDCDGDACPERRAVFIGDDGSVSELHGDANVWVSDDGESSNVRVIKMGAGNEFHFGDGHDLMIDTGGSYLGVQLSELTDQLRTHFGVPEGEGVLLSEIVEQIKDVDNEHRDDSLNFLIYNTFPPARRRSRPTAEPPCRRTEPRRG